MNPADVVINRICLPDLPIEQVCNEVARAGFGGVTPWHSDLQGRSVDTLKRLIRDAGLFVGGFCNCGLYAAKGRGARSAALDEARANIDVAAELGADTIVTVVGGLFADDRKVNAARAYAYECLADTLEHARTTPVTLALEPLHPLYTPDWSVLNRLSDANDWAERLGGGIGVTLDSYHLWWDPELEREISRAGAAGKISALHLSDWLLETSDTLWDRGMPGEGVIDVPAFLSCARAAGYSGPVEIEIFSKRLAKLAPQDFLQQLAVCMS